jgi:hypothetical protein
MNNHQLPNRFSLQKGCFFQRVAPDAIRVWRRGHCYDCQQPISSGLSTVYCTDDKEATVAGLWKTTSEPPPEGYTKHTGAMPLCGICLGKWRNPAKAHNGPLQEPFHD